MGVWTTLMNSGTFFLQSFDIILYHLWWSPVLAAVYSYCKGHHFRQMQRGPVLITNILSYC